MVLGAVDEVMKQRARDGHIRIGTLSLRDAARQPRHTEDVRQIVGAIPRVGLGPQMGFELRQQGGIPGPVFHAHAPRLARLSSRFLAS